MTERLTLSDWTTNHRKFLTQTQQIYSIFEFDWKNIEKAHSSERIFPTVCTAVAEAQRMLCK